MTTTTALAEFHDELRAVARQLLAPASPLDNGGDPAGVDWRQLAQAGWPGLEVPEHLGGAGASFAEVAVVVEELGRAAAAAPFLGSAVLAVGALAMVGPSPGRDELLAGIAAGDVRAAVALATGGVGGAPPFRVERRDGVVQLTGQATFVPDAAGADRLLLVATDPSAGPVLVDASVGVDDGIDVTAVPVVDATRSFADVAAEDVEVDERRVWPLGDPLRLQVRGALAVALDSVGVAQAALDATVAYAAVRHQFGRPIGSFQAVKHACADVAVELAISRRLVTDAVEQVAAGGPDAEVAVSMAKAHASETAVHAAGAAMQLHGGIGYTWESGVHALLKRATLNRSLFGSPAAHRARLAQRYAAAASL